MKAARDGHLLVSSCTTPDASATWPDRLVVRRKSRRSRGSRLLRHCMPCSQRLLARGPTGVGRAAALEVLLATGRARDMSASATARRHGTRLHQGVARVSTDAGRRSAPHGPRADDVVTYETGVAASSNPSDFQLQMKTLRRRRASPQRPQPSPGGPATDKARGVHGRSLDACCRSDRTAGRRGSSAHSHSL